MKMKKIIALLILLSLFLILITTETSAYNLIGGRFTRGVGNTCYYVDGSVSNYTSSINAAARNWVNTGYGANPIYMTAVSSNRGTHIDLYGKTSTYWGSSNVRGETRMFNSSSQDITSQIKNTNWFFAEISLNTSVLVVNAVETQGTVAHEMGHAFGLHHVDNVYVLMHGYSSERKVHVVTQDENDGINAIY